MFFRLEYTDRNFDLVFIPMARHAIAFAYYQEMQGQLQGIDRSMLELEMTLYPLLEMYYRKLAALTEPAFEPEALTSRSRWCFFVGGEVPLERSGLEQLLGLVLPSESDDATPQRQPACTTGDPLLDLEVDLLLLFKEAATDLMQRRSLIQLDKMAAQASQRQDPEVQKQAVREQDKALFEVEENKAALRAHYERKGIVVPDDF